MRGHTLGVEIKAHRKEWWNIVVDAMFTKPHSIHIQQIPVPCDDLRASETQTWHFGDNINTLIDTTNLLKMVLNFVCIHAKNLGAQIHHGRSTKINGPCWWITFDKIGLFVYRIQNGLTRRMQFVGNVGSGDKDDFFRRRIHRWVINSSQNLSGYPRPDQKQKCQFRFCIHKTYNSCVDTRVAGVHKSRIEGSLFTPS